MSCDTQVNSVDQFGVSKYFLVVNFVRRFTATETNVLATLCYYSLH